MKRLLRGLALGIALLPSFGSGAGCSADEPPRSSDPQRSTGSEPGVPHATTALECNVSVGDSDGAQTFRDDEPVTLVLTVHNVSDAPRSLALPSAQTFEFAVTSADGAEVWRWSQGRMFAQMLTELSLAPGESRRFEARWDRTRPDGTRAGPGEYRVVGSIPALEPGRAVSRPVAFTLE